MKYSRKPLLRNSGMAEMHPYRSLPDSAFWSRGVAGVASHELDPLVGKAARISPVDPVMTMGSCFAQHISRYLSRTGFNFLVTESGPLDLGDDERIRLGFGVFTARYGNVYTVRQAVQLFDRSFGYWVPEEVSWRNGDKWVDPFRPTIEPGGFDTEDLLLADRERHLGAVRDGFRSARFLVLTLGLTECWRSRLTGSVYPVVPGASGGVFDQDTHEFVNFGVGDVRSDLNELADRLHSVNPSLELILTVSPVPLIATYSGAHVLSATTYSKAVLRVAAEDLQASRESVYYFPSYEVITSPSSEGKYFADDFRSVREEGVAHVMRVLARNYLPPSEEPRSSPIATTAQIELRSLSGVVCDEEILDVRY